MEGKSLLQKEGWYSLKQQISASFAVCVLASLSFLPYIMNMDLHDEDPDTPYSGAADDMKIDIVNAIIISSISIMCLEAFLDSNTRYIPIKIAFSRFIVIMGILVVSIFQYSQQGDGMESWDRLSLLVCAHYAKIYFICAGIALRLLRDAAERGNKEWRVYVVGIMLCVTEMTLRQWGAYYQRGHATIVAQYCVTLSTLMVGVYIILRVIQHYLSHEHDSYNIGMHYYDYMSHFIVCIFLFGVNTINVAFGFQTYKNTTSNEIAAYHCLGLFAASLFFFTSSYIAQQHFVKAEGLLINKKNFVRYVSHEIRTPLNTVYVGIQLLTAELKQLIDLKKCEGASKLQDIVKDIGESCSISIDILNDLLLIDKIEEGNLVLDMRPRNAKDLFEPCIQHFDVQALYSNIDLLVDLQALSNVTMNVDEAKIVQVVRNIVSNALKFTPRGGHVQVKSYFTPHSKGSAPSTGISDKLKGSASRIYVAPAPSVAGDVHGNIRIEFLDTGPGMSEENKAKLFEAVVQFDVNVLQSGGGSGLGLFISNAIVKRHQGGMIGVVPGGVVAEGRVGDEGGVQLAASDSATTGCMFFIELDGYVRAEERERGSERECTHRSNGSSTFNRHSHSHRRSSTGNVRELITPDENASSLDAFEAVKFEKVLVVEDSKFNRKMMTKALSSYANEIVLAEDGVEAVTAVRGCAEKLERPFDVIFMDSLMPNMNGIDATRIILRELNFPNPIVAVTGNMLPQDVREFEEAGALTVLGKPLQLEKLDRVLKGIHAESRSKETRRKSSTVTSLEIEEFA